MAQIVEEEVELHLVDTRQLVDEAKKLKEIQKLKKQSEDALKKTPQKLREEKEQMKRLRESAKDPLTSSKSPVPFLGKDETLPKRELQKQTRKGAITGQKTSNEFTKLKKKVKEFEKKQKEILKTQDSFRNKLLENVNLGTNLISDANISGIASGVLVKLGPIGVAIGAVIAALLPGLMTQYERGGIFSTKLPITQQEKTVNEIDYVVDVASGTKFLTSDLRIAQKAPDTSNTQNLRYEHIRYVAQENGK